MNIVFDFGNVLVRWEPERMFAGLFEGDEARYWYFWRHVCSPEWRNRIDAGEEISSCIALQQQQFPEYAEALARYDTRWKDSLTGEIAPEKRKRFDEVVARYMSLCQVFPIADLSEKHLH